MRLVYIAVTAGLLIFVHLALVSTASVQAAEGTLADSNGTVAAWGRNDFGQTSVPSGQYTAIDAGRYHNLGIKSDGTLAGWGDNYWGQTNVPAGTFTAIAAGNEHSLGIKSNGTITAWGSTATPSSSSARTRPSTLAISISWGSSPTARSPAGAANDSGQTSVPSGTYTAIAAGGSHSLGIKSDGTLAGWGSNANGQSSVPSGTFTAIAAGDFHSLGIRSNGTLAGWGDNGSGQSSVPGGTFTAIAAGFAHSLGIRSDGTLAGWGFNLHGQTNVPGGTYVAVDAGREHSLALAARTDYDGDLRIYGTGMTANLNRSLQVAGDLIVETTVKRFNNATAEVDGRMVLRAGANLADGGLYTVNGVRVESDFVLPAAATIANSGPLTGTGSFILGTGAHFDIGLAPASAYSGVLSLATSASLAMHGTGVQTAYLLGVSDNAEVRMGAGQLLRLTNTTSGFALLNSGKVELLGSGLLGPSEIDVAGAATNSGDGLLTGRDAILRFTGGMSNSASIAVTGGVNDISGDITNSPGGKMIVTGGATSTFYDDIVNNGVFTVRKLGSSMATAIFLGGVSGSGGFNGGGDLIFEGDLSPGNSPATVNFDNNVTLGAASQLTVELGGTAPGSQYDQIRVTGDLSLDGSLNVSLINGFVPGLSDQFTVLTFGSRSGDFASYSGLDVGGHLSLRQAFTANSLVLTARPTIDGDINLDGTVDIFDVNNVSAHWRKPARKATPTATGSWISST